MIRATRTTTAPAMMSQDVRFIAASSRGLPVGRGKNRKKDLSDVAGRAFFPGSEPRFY
jgi:hypothetical protein